MKKNQTLISIYWFLNKIWSYAKKTSKSRKTRFLRFSLFFLDLAKIRKMVWNYERFWQCAAKLLLASWKKEKIFYWFCAQYICVHKIYSDFMVFLAISFCPVFSQWLKNFFFGFFFWDTGRIVTNSNDYKNLRFR